MTTEASSEGVSMSAEGEEFWSAVPEKAHHPVRVPMLEALRWIGEPLSAIGFVDVLDGLLSMWEVAHHLQVLETLEVVEPASVSSPDKRKESGFEVAYRLKKPAIDDD